MLAKRALKTPSNQMGNEDPFFFVPFFTVSIFFCTETRSTIVCAPTTANQPSRNNAARRDLFSPHIPTNNERKFLLFEKAIREEEISKCQPCVSIPYRSRSSLTFSLVSDFSTRLQLVKFLAWPVSLQAIYASSSDSRFTEMHRSQKRFGSPCRPH